MRQDRELRPLFDEEEPQTGHWIRLGLILCAIVVAAGYLLFLQFGQSDARDHVGETLVCPFDGSPDVKPRDDATPYGILFTCDQCRRTVYFLPRNEDGKPVFFSDLLAQGGVPPAGNALEGWEEVVRQIDYRTDQDFLTLPRDFWQPPAVTARKGHGDCEDSSIYLLSRLLAGGHTARMAIGQAQLGSRFEGHAWVVLEQFGQCYVLETAQNPREDGSIPIRPIPCGDSRSRYRPEFLLGPSGVMVTENPRETPYFSPMWRRAGK